MFSQSAEYAIRAVVMLAYMKKETLVGSKELAQRVKVPVSYLPKLMQNLVKVGIVDSKRGVGGGFSLRKSPDEITILDVVNAVDPIKRIVGCPLGLESHGKVLCPMHARLDQAMAEVESMLSASTIAELLTDQSRPTPMEETARFLDLRPPERTR
jgi:Rrf2 family transcriptional regulator, nitric oxide-sensitive transcriptional repressor